MVYRTCFVGNMNNENADLTPYLSTNPFCVVADWLYKAVFEPVFAWVHSFNEAHTRGWCEWNLNQMDQDQ